MADKQLQDSLPMDVVYAGFWRRACAIFIDIMLFALPSTLIGVISFRLMKNLFVGGDAWTVADYMNAQVPYNIIMLSSFISQLGWVLAISWFLAKFKWQATPGKRILKVYVVKADGSKLDYKTAFIRSLFPILIIVTLNLTNFFVLSKKENVTENAYENGMKEYFPVLQKTVEDSGKTYDEFIQTVEGREAYIKAFDSLDSTKKDELTKKIQAMIEQGKKYMNLLQFLPLLFGGMLLLWHSFAGFTKQKTAVHDIILGTRVVMGKVN